MTFSSRLGRWSGVSTVLVLTLSPALVGAPAHAEPRDPWWFQKMRLAQAHEETQGEGMRVCVIDSSINPDIPELEGADLHLAGGTKPYPRSGYAGHGTAMVALLIGQGKGTYDGRGILGIAPKARVDFYGVTTEPYDDTIIQDVDYGLEKATADGCKIISVSLASGSDLDYDTQVAAAQKAGAIVVAGAGVAGNAFIGYPAGNKGAVAVGAVNEQGRNWDKQPATQEGYLSISAPGVDVLVGGTVGPPRNARWDSNRKRTGTSPATPLVAGALALAWSKWPDATANQMIQHLVHNTNDSDGKLKWDYARSLGFGIANVTRMLAKDPSGWPDENPLLLRPDQALKKYPQSIYGKKSTPTPRASERPASAEGDTDAGNGLPVLPIGIAVVALIAVAGVATVLVRRRSTTPSREDH